MGCSFELANDGLEAVSKMNLSKYDLVLMDIVMPNLDGISATSQIRQFDPTTPVISMTSNTTQYFSFLFFSFLFNLIGKNSKLKITIVNNARAIFLME